MYDLIIIGAGPAGFTAGIYAIRREMKVLIIGSIPGGQIVWASEIENYPGFRNIASYELISKMQDHVKDLGVEIVNDKIINVKKNKDKTFTLLSNKQEFVSKAVIIATGLSPRELSVQGEKEFLGKGVTYCANCDAPFYRNKTVAVVGGGNAALDAAEILSKIAKKVYLIHRREEFRGFEVLVNEIKNRKNIELITNSEISKITGNEKVEKINVKNNKLNKITQINIDGIFIEIGRIAHTEIFSNFIELDNKKQIKVDEHCKTNVQGIFAAGDVTTVPYKQITIACGQATIAVLSAYEYLQLTIIPSK